MCHFVKLNPNRFVPLTCRIVLVHSVWRGEDITSEQDNHSQAHSKTKQNTDTQLRVDRAHQRCRQQNTESYVQNETLGVFCAFETVFFIGKVVKTCKTLNSFC